MTRRRGGNVTAGLSAPCPAFPLKIMTLAVGEEGKLTGSYIRSCVPVRDVPRHIEWHKASRLTVDSSRRSRSPSAYEKAAIDDEGLAGDVGGARARQEGDHRRYVLGVARAADRPPLGPRRGPVWQGQAKLLKRR